MDTTINGGSARIYQFPVRDRLTAAAKQRDIAEPASYLGVAKICDAAIEGAWYHGEAVRDDERARHTIVPVTFPRSHQ